MKVTKSATSNRYAFCFIFDEDGNVLVLKRAGFMRSRPNEWDLPGGTLEFNEEHQPGVIREVYEETGLKIADPELIVRKAGNWQGTVYEFSYYRCTTRDRKILLSEEHTAYEWHRPLVASALVTFKPHLMGFEEARRIVDK
jgi:8-oxo-dGTP pyrophosphatase MutT (NUDIX family)